MSNQKILNALNEYVESSGKEIRFRFVPNCKKYNSLITGYVRACDNNGIMHHFGNGLVEKYIKNNELNLIFNH